MTSEEYQREYDRLFKWRAAWSALSNKREPGRLAVRQERIEERAAIANRRIGALMHAFDEEQCAPYRKEIEAFVRDAGPVYRQDIFDRFQTPGRTNARLIGDAVAQLEREGSLKRASGPCSVHKGPLYTAASGTA